jgi:hypothetical protein
MILVKSTPWGERAHRLVAIVFGLCCAAWCFTVPYEPERLTHYIPTSAVAVLQLDDAYGQLSALPSHSLVQGLIATGVIDRAVFDSLNSDSRLGSWLERLCSDASVLAYVPRRAGSLRVPEGWMFGTWIGGYSTVLGVGLSFASDETVSSERFGVGHLIYRLPGLQNGYRVAFAVEAGVLLGYVSPGDAGAGLKAMLRRGDFAREQATMVTLSPEPIDSESTTTLAFDRARFTRLGQSYSPDYISASVELEDPSRLVIDARVRWGLNRSVLVDRDAPELKALGPILGDSPDAIYLGGLSTLRDLLGDEQMPQWGLILFNRLFGEERQDRLAFLAMMSGEERSGRIGMMTASAGGQDRQLRELQVPTFIGGVYMKGRENEATLIPSILDLLNARYQFGVIPRQEVIEGVTYTVIDPVVDSGYSRQHPDYRIALAEVDGWLIISAHLKPLRALLSPSSEAPASDTVAWLDAWTDDKCRAGVWINTQNTKPFRDVMACARMMGLLRTSAETQSIVKRVLNSLGQYEACVLEVLSESDGAQVRLHVQ